MMSAAAPGQENDLVSTILDVRKTLIMCPTDPIAVNCRKYLKQVERGCNRQLRMLNSCKLENEDERRAHEIHVAGLHNVLEAISGALS